ncbi:MAG: cytochrome c, partial [Burkholderiales bacterium]|nr:cytochrome c [Anaerolineae bacterium]
AIDNGYNPDEPDRLGVVGWVSSLDQYIHTTLIHGRPGSENYWDSEQGMAAWGQIGGGPLRDDQLKDLGEYIQNYERDWTLEDLLAVNQFGIVPLNPAGVVLGEPFVPVGTNINIALAEIAAVPADPQTGLTLYASFGCEDCHGGGVSAPLTEGTAARVEQERLPLPQFEGYTVEEYLVESILNPGAFTAPGYQSGLMPANFGERLSAEDLAHIVAYLMSQDAE